MIKRDNPKKMTSSKFFPEDILKWKTKAKESGLTLTKYIEDCCNNGLTTGKPLQENTGAVAKPAVKGEWHCICGYNTRISLHWRGHKTICKMSLNPLSSK